MSRIQQATIEGDRITLNGEERDGKRRGPFLIHKGFDWAWQRWVIAAPCGSALGNYTKLADARTAADAILKATPPDWDWQQPMDALPEELRRSLIAAVRGAGVQFA